METAEQNILNVNELEPRRKHAAVFERFDQLTPGDSFTLVVNHDPKPLFYQLQADRGDIFNWDYLESGPVDWKIKITRKEDEIFVLNAPMIEPRFKHEVIFQKFDSLEEGESFILLNDHDPKPLYYQLSATRGDIFNWEYLEKGPDDYRILITKKVLTPKAAPVPVSTPSANSGNDVVDFVINVPEIEPRYKHPTIFQKFDELKPGRALIINNDHDPKPLFYQMQAERGDIFTWEYLKQGPDEFKIKVTKKLTGKSAVTLGEIVAKDLRYADVFNKYGLDFCCNGRKTLGDACAEKGVDSSKVENDLIELEKEVSSGKGQRSLPFNDWNLDFLADYIVNTHHSYIRKVTPELQAYALKVAKVHGSHHPELLEINDLVQEVTREMAEHGVKEENTVFPMIKKLIAQKNGSAGKPEEVQQPIASLIEEHDALGAKVDKIRELSHEFEVPSDGCASYAFLYKTLREYEEDLHIHVHLENNILFPKAIALEKEVTAKSQA